MFFYSALKRLGVGAVHHVNLLPPLEEVEGRHRAHGFALHQLGRLGGGVAYDLEEDARGVLVRERIEFGSDYLEREGVKVG